MEITREEMKRLPTAAFDDLAWVHPPMELHIELAHQAGERQGVIFEGHWYDKELASQITRYGGRDRKRLITSMDEATKIIAHAGSYDEQGRPMALAPIFFVLSDHTYAAFLRENLWRSPFNPMDRTIFGIPFVINRFIEAPK